MGYGTKRWQYKLTVVVSTPEGLKTGTTVRELSGNLQPPIMTGRYLVMNLARGEALVVDLGERGFFFAPLTGLYADNQILQKVFPEQCGGMGAKEDAACKLNFYAAHKATAPKIIDPEFYPSFVYFKDINDLSSKESLLQMGDCIDPKWKKCIHKDRFEEVFGQGVRLESVTLEMTDEPVRFKNASYMPWFEKREQSATGEQIMQGAYEIGTDKKIFPQGFRVDYRPD